MDLSIGVCGREVRSKMMGCGWSSFSMSKENLEGIISVLPKKETYNKVPMVLRKMIIMFVVLFRFVWFGLSEVSP